MYIPPTVLWDEYHFYEEPELSNINMQFQKKDFTNCMVQEYHEITQNKKWAKAF